MYACTYIPLEVGLAPLVALGWGAASLSTSGSRGCRGSHKRDPVKSHTPHWDRGPLDQRHSALRPVEEEKGERREGKGVEKGHTVNKNYCLRHCCK